MTQEWQPIETAPRDGTRILGYSPSKDATVCETWWVEDYLQDEWGVYIGGWDDDWDLNRKPTHWMPLPEPPQ